MNSVTRRLSVLLVLAAVAALSVASPALSREAERRALDSITLEGRGNGHGHGMSQWGAEGAAQQGLTYGQILSFYYPGTQRGTAGGPVRVLISADTSPDVVVAARDGLTARSLGSQRTWRLSRLQPRATSWRIDAAGPGRSEISFRRANGGWKRLAVARGDAEFAAGGAPIRLRLPGGSVEYRGTLRSASSDDGTERDTVNIVSLETYLQGVVPREVPALWHVHAVRAQAVAARTYAAFERDQPLADHYEICDTAQCQVYGGYSSEHPASNAAVRATAGEILTEGGAPAFAQFSASNGGWTVAGDFDYLPAQEDPYDRVPDDNPYLDWSRTITDDEIERAYPAIGDLLDVEVGSRDGRGAWGGRVLEITLTGTSTSTTLTGSRFRSVFGLYETYFQLV
ncbi:MAG: SpoIID/LytB domain-containing protein [Actinobacteria bacterium]|uniref:Unannotated protein n=1 Tax=freshwater metagenome TaxID=449393 RepID=A0A6J6P0N3_9ZZZZ|nr:SpoIID/LytB domain-containing protein [Actinomycetota bacterium]